MTTRTSAWAFTSNRTKVTALYAAMPPVTTNTIFLPTNMAPQSFLSILEVYFTTIYVNSVVLTQNKRSQQADSFYLTPQGYTADTLEKVFLLIHLQNYDIRSPLLQALKTMLLE
ncbi:hypothetical protein WVI01_13680 [Weissella viridescens]|nr:hypothetical protein WVI01_13680 [Weissella viridescens]